MDALRPTRPLEISLRRPLFFVHIPKAAGCSIRQLLANRFPAEMVRCLDEPQSSRGNWQDLGRHTCYFGHQVYRFAEALPYSPAVMTILREPMELAVSAFYFGKNAFRNMGLEGRQGYRAAVCDLSLDEFLRAEPVAARRVLGNVQTAMFSFSRAIEIHERDVTAADLEVAKQNLARCAVVGLVERLTESLRLLCHTFGWPMLDRVPWENKNLVRNRVADHDPETLQQLRQLTALDAELYRCGVELFEQQLGTVVGLPAAVRAA